MPADASGSSLFTSDGWNLCSIRVMGTLRDEKLGKFQSTHSQTPVVLLGFLLIIVINIPEVLGGKFSNAMGQISPHRHLNGIHGFPRKALKPDQHYEKGDQGGQEFFEVSKPVYIPYGAKEVCNQILVQHKFGDTIDDSEVIQKELRRRCRCDPPSRQGVSS